jgi:hypothetical protein
METNPTTSGPDWLKLAVVAVVAVGLSTLGWAVSDSFQPSSGGDPVAGAVGPSSTTSTTVVALAEAGPTTTEADISTTSTDEAQPAFLELSVSEIDFGDSSDAIDLSVVNSGAGGATWGVETTGSGIVVIPSNGELSPGGSVALEVTLDRSQIPEGEFSTELAIVWSDGSVSVPISAVHNDNPVIHSPKASPATVVTASGQACSPTLTTISARVRDTSELDEVVVRWNNGSGTVESRMEPSGDDMFQAQIGPFSKEGSIPVKVVAFDILGNAGGASITVEVGPCS